MCDHIPKQFLLRYVVTQSYVPMYYRPSKYKHDDAWRHALKLQIQAVQCTRSANKAHRAGKQPSSIGREEKMKRSRKNRSLLNLESRQRHANYVHSRRNHGAEGQSPPHPPNLSRNRSQTFSFKRSCITSCTPSRIFRPTYRPGCSS